jgi:hypothetical protein
LGAYAEAQAWCAQFLQLSQRVEPPLGEFLDHLLSRTLLAHHSGDSLQALMCAEQSWQIAQRIGDPLRMAQALVLLGHVNSEQQPQVAAMAYRQALTWYEKLPQWQRATTPQAGLAQIALAQGDLAEAQHQVEAILPALARPVSPGVDEPFYSYWVCFQVLAASEDARALTLLQQANQLLQNDAGQIGDERLRRLFLEEVPAHRAVVLANASRSWLVPVSPVATTMSIMLAVQS